MMQVDVVCRYCYRRMVPHRSYTDPGVSDGRPYYEFNCKPCQSTQYFETSGRPLHYWFMVGPYKLYFIPYGYRTPLFQVCNGNLGPIFQLDYLPHHLTPQNCTEERIKTLILFS
jgi:hypothetical protein